MSCCIVVYIFATLTIIIVGWIEGSLTELLCLNVLTELNDKVKLLITFNLLNLL